MKQREFLGEFEQMVLLATLQSGKSAFAITLRRVLEESSGRSVSRGALYRTLDRLEEKGYLDWKLDEPTADRGGHPKRAFRVTKSGIQALRASRSALFKLWSGLDRVLGKP